MANFRNMEHEIKIRYATALDATPTNSNSSAKSQRAVSVGQNAAPIIADTDALANEQTATSPPTRNTKRKYPAQNLKFEIGEQVKFYDTDVNKLVFGTIIKQSKPNAYKVGGNGKVVGLNIDNIVPLDTKAAKFC